MRIAVCDDDKAFLGQLTGAIQTWQQSLQAVALECFEDGDSLIRAHTTRPFDVIFLDVVMPLLSGLDAAREIRQSDKTVRIVFFTSSPEFAVDSYRVKASDYLLKPLHEEQLRQCLDELWEQYHSNARYIDIKSSSTVHRVALPNIAFIEAQNKHVQFFLTDGTVILASEPLYSYEERLELADGFFKCSRSYIVNLHQIESYRAKEITTRGGFRIPISRNRGKEFEEAYFRVIFGKAGEQL